MLYVTDLYGQQIAVPDIGMAVANALDLVAEEPDLENEDDVKAYDYWIDILGKLKSLQNR